MNDPDLDRQVVESEQYLIGCLLLGGDVDRAASLLDANSFLDHRHRLIFAAICSLHGRREAVDLPALQSELGGSLSTVGGTGYLAGLMDSVPSGELSRKYTRLVCEAHSRRRRLQLASAILKATESEDYERADALVEELQELTAVADTEDFAVIGADALLAGAYPRREDVVGGGLLPRGGLAMLVGPPKGGKTILALQLAVSIAQGKPFLGREAEAGRVVYLSGEGGPPLMAERLTKMVQQSDAAVIKNLSFRFDPLMINNPANTAGLTKFCTDQGIDVVIVDPLIRFHTADENSTSEMGSLVRNLAAFRKETGCAVMLVHHTRKQGTNSTKGSAAEARGSSVLHGEVDASLVVDPRRGDGDFRLDMELRWDAAPGPVLLKLDPDTLTMEIVGELESGPKIPLKQVLALVQLHELSTAQHLAEVAGVSKATMLRYLNRLDSEGKILSRPGKANSRLWTSVSLQGLGI